MVVGILGAVHSELSPVTLVTYYELIVPFFPQLVCVVCLKWPLRRLVATAAVVQSLVAKLQPPCFALVSVPAMRHAVALSCVLL